MILKGSKIQKVAGLARGRLRGDAIVAVRPWSHDNPYLEGLYSARGFSAFANHNIKLIGLMRRLGLLDALHIHWEEGIFWAQPSMEPQEAANRLIADLASLVAAGLPLIWTCHNYLPHSIKDSAKIAAFLSVRRYLVDAANMIHVHSPHARDFLVSEFDADSAKIEIVAHPSYEGLFPTCTARVELPERRRFLVFGTMRPDKGADRIINAFLEIAQPGRVESLTLRGSGRREDLPDGPEAIRINYDLRRVPDAELPQIFAETDFVVLALERSLTSGSALLPLCFGVPVIVPRFPGVMQNLPDELDALAYMPGNQEGLVQAIDRACTLSNADFVRLSERCIEYAKSRSPFVQSSLLLSAVRRHGIVRSVS